MLRHLGDYLLRSVTKEVITVHNFNRRRACWHVGMLYVQANLLRKTCQSEHVEADLSKVNVSCEHVKVYLSKEILLATGWIRITKG